MSLVINTNLGSLNAQRQLERNQTSLDNATERLVSGKRINSAGDDAAGLAISNKMTSQIRGLNQAVRNANDGISLLQTAEGALDESTSILQRMRELSIQSASGTYSDQNRAMLDAEFQQLSKELTRIAETTSFNGQTLLDGSKDNIELQIGANANEVIEVGLEAMDASSLGLAGVSGDLVGAQLNIDSDTGKLAVNLSHSVNINGHSIGSMAEGSTVQSLVDRINNDIGDVSASTVLDMTASSVGAGVLSGGDALTFKVFDLDGSQVTYSISNTTDLADLADAITTKTAGRLNATITDEGKLNVVSDSASTVLVQDSTAGVASGIDTGSIEDPGIANIIDGLKSFWVSEAETRITDFFGLTGSGNIELNLFTDAQYGQLASVSFTMVNPATGQALDLNLNIDLADYGNVTMPDGDNGGLFSLDRVIAHEMVHAVMAVTMDITKAGDGLRISDDKDPFPGWFTEGMAELIHGADDRVNQEITYIDTEAELQTLFDETKAHGSPSSPGGYSVAYLAAKMLQDDIYSNNTDGVKLLFDRLELGDSLDEAIISLNGSGQTQFANLADFETHFRANGYEYLTSAASGVTSTLALGNADTGSIAGTDYSGVVALNATDVFANNAGSGPAADFTLVIPDEYSGNYFTADAQLVLTSDSGDPITVTKSATGTDQNLLNFGFSEVSGAGQLLGQALNETAQKAELAVNDLIINGVSVAPVESDAGLMAKVQAINDVSDETGVIASIAAEESFGLNDDSTTAYATTGGAISSAGGVLGFNGVGFNVAAGATASDIAAQVNGTTTSHGVTAYADDAGQLHFFSESVINLGGAVATELVGSYGLSDTGAAGTGSVRINATEISLSDIDNAKTMLDEINAAAGNTGVVAEIDDNGQLQLASTAAIKISLGDTNGLQTLNAMGISFGVNGDENLADSDSDGLLGDEVFTLQSRIRLDSRNDASISIDVTAAGYAATGLVDMNASESVSGSSLSSQGITTQSDANKAIISIDHALDQIDTVRADIGAVINRLDFSISNLANISENTAGARSQIVDADFAKESASLSRTQVLRQAASAMLAQANAAPQQVLSLLR